jgi:hypothetical protein
VLLFTQILTEREAATKSDEKRHAERFAVGPTFPLETVLTLRARDPSRNLIDDSRRTQAWGARLKNLSEIGASVMLSTAAIAQRGESCRLKFSLAQRVFEIAGTIVHFRVLPQYASFGVAFVFTDETTRNAYRQLLEPVKIGASLVQSDAEKIEQDATGLSRAEYDGHSGSKLIVWRPSPNAALQGFDFRMNRYGIRWTQGMPTLQPYGLASIETTGKNSSPLFLTLNETELAEVRWLFCLSVPNLSKAVPLDVRKFLAKLVA